MTTPEHVAIARIATKSAISAVCDARNFVADAAKNTHGFKTEDADALSVQLRQLAALVDELKAAISVIQEVI